MHFKYLISGEVFFKIIFRKIKTMFILDCVWFVGSLPWIPHSPGAASASRALPLLNKFISPKQEALRRPATRSSSENKIS